MQEQVKQQIALGPHTSFRGYQHLGSNVTRYEGGFQRDWHEAIDLYKEEDPQAVLVSPKLPPLRPQRHAGTAKAQSIIFAPRGSF